MTEYCPACGAPYESKQQQSMGTRNSKSGGSRLDRAVEEFLEVSKIYYKTSLTIHDHLDKNKKERSTPRTKKVIGRSYINKT